MPRVSIDERRAQLIEATATVLAERGISAVSTRSITAQAGAPLAILHYAFGSLEALLEATMLAQVDAELEVGLTAVAGAGSPVEAIARVLTAYLDLVRSEEGRERGLIELMLHAGRQPGLRELAPQLYRRYHAAMAEIAETIARHGGWEWRVPVAQVARFSTVQTDGLVLAWFATQDEELLAELIAAAAQALAGLVAEPGGSGTVVSRGVTAHQPAVPATA